MNHENDIQLRHGQFLAIFTRWMLTQPPQVRHTCMKVLRGDNYLDEEQRKVCSAFKTELQYQAKNNTN